MKEPFEQVVRRHGASVFRVCRALLGAGADAEDAWSEVFLAALRSWPELPEGMNVEAWLVTVAKRKAIDIIRARDRRAVPAAELREGHSPHGNPGGEHLGLWQAVAALPERQRLALAYHYLGGLRHTETAQLIGSTPDAVRRAAADGLKTLRRSYHDRESPAEALRADDMPAGRFDAGERPEGAQI
ncbi:sigma-70 family RNA polymerase sigma factor [Brevibacterium daeguense]|uniref:Sigma-70 family RNA polymerase sigma factor n=1 Tax=Brevibacterium daeguense TaxID=909936 RepID=A0ABP8EG61_9MICO|nr:sigma-70 family RNA polymerase sigma factor [Brevibacterium daeguense]